MKKKVSILGSTGSIGKNGLDVVSQFEDKFEIVALSANNNFKMLIEQAKRFKPKYVCVGTEEGYKEAKKELVDIEIFMGEEGLREIGRLKEHDILLTAVMGAIGIEATIEAIKNDKIIALANKETMVEAGGLINELLTKHRAKIIPVDSEHSAIYQSMKSGTGNEINKIILTASGGPFRKYTKEKLQNVTLQEALKHPNWKMGNKITIDSATLVNKGLEVIEAHYLFNIDYDKIDVVVHPESIIHSMVEYKDTSVIAQMGLPDMRLPIQYAFTYPDRFENKKLESLDLIKVSKMTFEKPDREVFRGLDFAFESGKLGESMPVVLNAANEEAVDLFLNSKIGFLDIYKIIEKCMSEHSLTKIDSIEKIKSVDRFVREKIKKDYKNIVK